jgi:hypothetical protein
MARMKRDIVYQAERSWNKHCIFRPWVTLSLEERRMLVASFEAGLEERRKNKKGR